MSEPRPILPPPTPPPASPPAPAEEASSQALAEALRSSFVIIKVIMAVLVALFLGSGFFTVGTQEKAILLRLGKPVSEDESALLGPGAHFAFPRPIDEVVKIPLGQVQSVTSSVGWHHTTAVREAAQSEPPPGPVLVPGRDGYLLTGDGYLIHARATLQYRIAEPGLRYQLELAGASNLVQNALNNALVYAAAHSTIEITRDATSFREKADARLAQLIARQNLGIKIEQMAVQVIPPRQLAEDFAQVATAEVKRNTALNEARQHENKVLSQARAEAKARVNTAEAERRAVVELVAAEAKRFQDLLPEYRKNPRLFAALLQADAWQRIYTNAAEKIIMQERGDGRLRELRLLLNREPLKPKAPEPEPAGGHKH
jgi:membrane protease subunit HflK